MPEAERIASGPKRAPDRNDVAPSQGMPKTAAWAFSRSCTYGSRANVRGPVNRGAESASQGSYTAIDLLASRPTVCPPGRRNLLDVWTARGRAHGRDRQRPPLGA